MARRLIIASTLVVLAMLISLYPVPARADCQGSTEVTIIKTLPDGDGSSEASAADSEREENVADSTVEPVGEGRGIAATAIGRLPATGEDESWIGLLESALAIITLGFASVLEVDHSGGEHAGRGGGDITPS